MPKINIEDLKDGMVVESDVRNLYDMTLLTAGARLTDSLIEKMVAWGVTEVDVRDSEEL